MSTEPGPRRPPPGAVTCSARGWLRHAAHEVRFPQASEGEPSTTVPENAGYVSGLCAFCPARHWKLDTVSPDVEFAAVKAMSTLPSMDFRSA